MPKDDMDAIGSVRKVLEQQEGDVLREGTYCPGLAVREPAPCRAERSSAVIAECYVRGVFTRRVDGLVRTLGIEGISKSQVSRLAATLDEQGRGIQEPPARWWEPSLPHGSMRFRSASVKAGAS